MIGVYLTFHKGSTYKSNRFGLSKSMVIA